MKVFSVTIDGPSGAGKSTVAKQLAERLNILYLDTGAMYRAIGLKALRKQVEPTDELSVCNVLLDTIVEIVYQNGQQVILDGENVTTDIREHAISKAASDVSAHPPVRKCMAELQRKIASKQSCVLDGRETGTYVLPNADYKFFLTASLDERAKRRHKELSLRGSVLDLEKVKKDIEIRDRNDANRSFAPLKQAEDALLIDSTALTCEEVVNKLFCIINEGNKV